MLKVIGIGNMLRGDDAVGPMVIEELLKCKDLPATLIDAGSDAFTVLEHLIGKDPLLIIDCAKMGKTPGDIVEFDISDGNIAYAEKAVSLHGFGFGDVYKMAKEIGPVAPCKIIGVEPKEIAFDMQISEDVKNSIPKIINLVNKEAHNA
jgi:hydrogenase maturation protease